MTRGVSYFQRFSQPENHATNNTLLALRHFYQTSPFKIERLLNELLDAKLSVGLAFEQQVKGATSVPDALISQEQVRIFVETKRGSEVDIGQIRRHLDTISKKASGASNDFLIALTREPIPEAVKSELAQEAHAKRITFAAVTFSRLVEGLEAQCSDYEWELRALLDDFKDYLAEEELLDERSRWLAIFPCGTSFEENVRFGVYYEPPSRASKAGRPFIGLYRQKAVSYVGRVEAVVVVTCEASKFSFDAESGIVTAEHEARIIQTIEKTTYYDLKAEPHRFYVVDKFSKTDAKKVSANGIMGFRYLDLSKLIKGYTGKEEFSSKSLADAISGSTWV